MTALPMSNVTCYVSTGSPFADQVIGNVIHAYESNFPNRVRAYYLIGSYADDTDVALSDIDLILFFKEKFQDSAEQQAAEQLARECIAASPTRLDLTPRGEDSFDAMFAVIRVALKDASVLVYGQDIRAQWQLPPIEQYTQDVIKGALFFIAHLHGLEQVTALPITYPNPTDEFFGYTQKRFNEWYPPEINSGTKELVATVSRIATATLALQANKYIGSKREAIELYQTCVGGTWAKFVSNIFYHCKQDWQYLIPETLSKRAELRALCRVMLAFESDFLVHVRLPSP